MGCCDGDKKYKDADYGNPGYTGPEPDERLKNGPIDDRSCTDLICCVIFVAFWGAMVVICYRGVTNGTPEKYLGVYDASGNMCGQSAGYENHKYIYFWLPITGYLNKTTCISACPQDTTTDSITCYYQLPGSTAEPSCKLDCKTNTLVDVCYAKSGINFMDLASLTNYSAIQIVYPTIPRFGMFCIPAQLNETMEQYYAKVKVYIESIDYLTNGIADIQAAQYVVVGSCGISLFLGFIFMVIMKACAGPVTWFFIILCQSVLCAVTYFVYDYAMNTIQPGMDAQIKNGDNPGRNYYLYGAYGCAAITAAYFITICCLYSKIRIAIRIMETAADFVTEVCLIVLVPPITTLLISLWVMFWVPTFVYVWCQGEFAAAENGAIYGKVTWTEETRYSVLVYLFGGLWGAAFISACNQFIIASAACIWYFSPRKTGEGNENDKDVEMAITRSVYRMFRYHLGSLAFGSFLVAVVQFCRIILEYMHAQVKASGGDKQSKLVEYAFKAAKCMLACFERVIKFINKNAYIQIAITSNSFCIACKDAFFLILRNTALFAIVAGIGEVFIWVGRVFITLTTVIACFFIINNYEELKNELHNFYVPLFAIAIIAGAIGYMFMCVWSMAADAILQCFCVDKELNAKGGPVPNIYCPAQLLEFVQDDYNKLQGAQQERKLKREQDKFNAKREKDPEHGKADGGCCC